MPEIQCRDIGSVQDLLERVAADTKGWTHDGFAKPWFRGVTDTSHKLLPSILRDGNERHEFNLTKKFRLMAPGFGTTPDTGRIDQWLFLMQHHQAPTRLLDWTESPLVAAFFATEKAAKKSEVNQDAAIYALDPMALNEEAGLIDKSGKAYFPVTWSQNPILQTIKFAFGTQDELVNEELMPYLKLPVAIYPSTVHARVSSQRSCFTLHGSDNRDFVSIFCDKSLIKNKCFIKFRIPKECVKSVFEELSKLGITYAALFPDLDGLARELRYSFGIKG